MMPYRNQIPPTLFVLFSLLVLLSGTSPVFGSAPWHHVSTAHFGLSYTAATEHLVAEAAQIAEETRSALTEYFGNRADVRFLSIVLADDSDVPNGGASILDPVVWIDCRKTQGLFRGETAWLRTVLTHELSHQYSLHLLKKLDWVKLADNVTVAGENYSVTMDTGRGPLQLPLWFIEGMAQMGSRRVAADSHDAVRRMVLREAFSSGRLLSLEEMGRFEGTQRDQEMVYNQGFSFLQYLEETYPKTSLADLCMAVTQAGFVPAFEALYRLPLNDLYRRWRDSWGEGSQGLPPPTGTKLFAKTGAMVSETSTAGPYVVANWDSDYHRFGLYLTQGDDLRLMARDTGPLVKSEGAKKGAWYSQQTFDITKGTVGYEVFHLDSQGNSRQMTHGSRVLAFDVLDGHLAYARYRDGQTELVIRRPDGTETSLGLAPEGTAVYSLSLVNLGTALVSLGTGPRVNAAVVSKGSWNLLWPEAEVMDIVAAGEDRVIFSSTLEGSPQLYWADLVRAPDTWHPITKAAFGARFPAWDHQEGQLTFSEYREGGWRRMAWQGELRTTDETKPSGPVVTIWHALPAPASEQVLKATTTNAVLHLEPITLGLFLQKNDNQPVAALGMASWSASVYNAPGDWSVSGAYTAQQVFSLVPSQPTHGVRFEASFDWGPLNNAVAFLYEAEAQYYNRYGYQFLSYVHRSVVGQSTLRTAKDQALSVAYRGDWSDHTTLSPAVTFYGLNTASLRWDWSHNPVSVFDPAQLGQPGWGGYAVGRLYVPQVLDPNYWDGSVVLLKSGPVPQLATGWGYRLLVEGSRLSVGAALEATSAPGAVVDAKRFPWALIDLRSMGFSGYPSGYASMVHLGLGRLAVKTNPLVETKDATQWFERLGLGASILAGAGQYFDPWGSQGLRLAFPASAEVSFSATFFDAPDHASEVGLGFAMALNDFASANGASPMLPFQVTAFYRY